MPRSHDARFRGDAHQGGLGLADAGAGLPLPPDVEPIEMVQHCEGGHLAEICPTVALQVLPKPPMELALPFRKPLVERQQTNKQTKNCTHH